MKKGGVFSKVLLSILVNFLGILLSLSSSSVYFVWVGMEISSYFFVPMMYFFGKQNFFSSWKYFLSQVVGSFMFFFSLVINGIYESIYSIMLIFSLFLKMGSFPFFSWMISLEMLDWWSYFFLSTFQKIPPLVVVGKVSFKVSWEVILFSLIGSLVSLVLFFNKNLSTRWIFLISSFYNSNWMILSSSMNLSSFLFFFFSYSFILYFISFFMFMAWKEFFSSTLKNSGGKSIFMLFLFFFFMGIPPLGGFITKIEVLSILIYQSESISLILILTSLISSYIYLKFVYKMSFFQFDKTFSSSEKSKFYSIFFFFLIFLFFLWILVK